MSSDKKVRPPPLKPTTTLIYKTVPSKTTPSLLPSGTNITCQPIPIRADIYLPDTLSAGKHKLLLFIHGGGWIHSNRTDYGPPLFKRLLSSGFVICSMDYRLCPETLFSGTCEDVKDIEGWLKNNLEAALQEDGHDVNIDTQSLVVVGGSAGAHLALLTVGPFPYPRFVVMRLTRHSQSSGPCRRKRSSPSTGRQTSTIFPISILVLVDRKSGPFQMLPATSFPKQPTSPSHPLSFQCLQKLKTSKRQDIAWDSISIAENYSVIF